MKKKIKLTKEQVDLIRKTLNEDIPGRKNLETDKDSNFLGSTKTDTIRLAKNRINEMASSPILSNMLSIFIILLTDKDSVSVLKSLGTQYAKQIERYTEENGLDFEETMVKALKPKLKRLLMSMIDEIKEQGYDDPTEQKPVEEKQTQQKQLDQDKNELLSIQKKFGIK